MTPFPRKRADCPTGLAGPVSLPDFGGATATAREPGSGVTP